MKHWSASLSPARRRRLVVTGAALVVVLAGGTTLLLHRQLGAMRGAEVESLAMLAEVEALAARHALMRTRAGQPLAAAELLQKAESSLAAAGLVPGSMQLEAGVMDLRFDGTDFNAVLGWLGSVQAWPGVTVSRFEASADGRGGARVTLSLRTAEADAGL